MFKFTLMAFYAVRFFIFLFLFGGSYLITIAQDTLALKKYAGNLRTVEIIIDKKKCRLLFDSGAGETFLSPSVIGTLNFKIYGQSFGFRMNGESIRYAKSDSVPILIGKQSVLYETVGVWDIMNILPSGFPRLDGVLSLKVFADKQVTIDLFNDRIIIETENSFKKKIQDKKSISCRFANGLHGDESVVFLAQINSGNSYWLLFDSGNLDNILLSHKTAFEWGLETAETKQRNEFKDIEIKIGHDPLLMNSSSIDMIHDGALNFDFLSRFQFHINFKTREIFLSKVKN